MSPIWIWRYANMPDRLNKLKHLLTYVIIINCKASNLAASLALAAKIHRGLSNFYI